MTLFFPVMGIFSFFMLPLIGVLSIFTTTFSALYAGIFLSCALIAYMSKKKWGTSVPALILCLAALGLFGSLMLSKQSIVSASQDIFAPIAAGGFPFRTFLYPSPPMGSDQPPFDMWGGYLNALIWLLVAIPISFLIRKRILKYRVATVLALAGFVSLWGLGYLVLQFD